MDFRALLIYVDDSMLKKPRRGGIGVRFVFPDFLQKEEMKKDFNLFGYKGATNNQMAIKACIVGLEEAMKLKEIQEKKINNIEIYIDSMYVVDNYPRAIYTWQKNNKWRLSSGAPVLNVDLWKDLIRSVKKIKMHVDIKKIKGHDKDVDNEAVDKLAKVSAGNARNKISEISIVRRKISKEKTQAGSVRMLNQRIKIRIISSRYLKEQKERQVRYEVISKQNQFYSKVDLIFSKYILSPGHKYLVKLNSDDKYPQIDKVIKEEK